jgi:hypothetical protein
MRPLGNASYCGDSEGSAEELKDFIAKRKQFLQALCGKTFDGVFGTDLLGKLDVRSILPEKSRLYPAPET